MKKIFEGLISQNGESEKPTINLWENSIGSIEFETNADGIYDIVSNGLFTEGKTSVEVRYQDGSDNKGCVVDAVSFLPNKIVLSSLINNVASDNVLNETYLCITVKL